MLLILPTLANETFSKEIGDYYPVLCNTFAQSTLSRSALWHKDQRRGFVVYEHSRILQILFLDNSQYFVFKAESFKSINESGYY